MQIRVLDKYISVRFICVLLLLIYSLIAIYENTHAFESFNDSTLRNIANEISNAIIEKDIETLLGYALPDSKKIAGELFEDNDSNFYKAFFGENDSYREFMINAHELDFYIYEYPRKDSGFAVFYYDKKLIKSLDKLSLDVIRSKAINGMVLEQFIFYFCDQDNKCRWYMNYQGHGYSGPDDEA